MRVAWKASFGRSRCWGDGRTRCRCAAARCRTESTGGARSAGCCRDGAATEGVVPGVARPTVSGRTLGAGDGGDRRGRSGVSDTRRKECADRVGAGGSFAARDCRGDAVRVSPCRNGRAVSWDGSGISGGVERAAGDAPAARVCGGWIGVFLAAGATRRGRVGDPAGNCERGWVGPPAAGERGTDVKGRKKASRTGGLRCCDGRERYLLCSMTTPPAAFFSFSASLCLRAPMAFWTHWSACARSSFRAASLGHSRSALRR